jgi:ABC-type lipoprotein export system ATPase subunit
MDAVLRAEQLEQSFGSFEVVHGASLSIAPAETVALIGPSGSGKTTLLHMVGLLDRPKAGKVWLGSTDVWALSASERAAARLREIGFVFQDRNLLTHLDALDNVALPAWRSSGSRSQALARAEKLLAMFGLESRAKTRASALSSGEQQRVAIARALVNEPKLVLADEPTGSLDSASAAPVLDALYGVVARNAALLVVTHDATVAARASRTITMKDGRLSL